MKYKEIVVGGLETNCYLVYCEETLQCAVVDPGAEPERIFLEIAEAELKPVVIINTHGHVDHIGANRDMKDHFGVPLYIHAADSPMLGKIQQLELSLFLGAKDSPPADHLMSDGEEIKIGNSVLRVLHTPGHSPGSVSLLGDGFLLSGDTLFFEGVGRTDLPGGSQKQLEQSLREKVMTLPDETVILPGHGPLTSVGQERVNNLFIT
ncbi:MAG: MBL fold metallo-hydrolase [Candidatus Aminicenantes bacterium]|nr:MBL fold metallo-hydrolase [Candidatus Aminicenantes bacterium]